MNRRAFQLSALYAGAALGALSNLPLLNLVNCLLCAWVWAGGFLAVMLYRRFQPDGPALTPAQGAGLGAVSGVVGAVVGLLVFIVTGFITLPLMASLARALQIQGDLPFQTGDFGSIAITGLSFFVLNLVLYPLFGAISGLIAPSLFKHAQAPAHA